MPSVGRVVRFYQSVFALRRGRVVERNLELYDEPVAVKSYKARSELTLCERYLVDRYIEAGSSILDVGVGAGRTTEELSTLAGTYVGIDYSPAMVEACRDRFPDLRFEVVDATDMSSFDDGSFEAMIFSYNGIDCLYPDEIRSSFLREAKRVLVDEGVLIFSSHNARGLLHPGNEGGGKPRKVWSSVKGTLGRLALYLPQSAIWHGRGFVMDPRYGGLVMHHVTPKHVAEEMRSMGFHCIEMVAGDYPERVRPWVTRWIYYVCRAGTGDPATSSRDFLEMA